MASEDREFYDWLSAKIVESAWKQAKNEEEYITENKIYPEGAILISKDKALANLSAIKIGDGYKHWSELSYIER